MFIEPLLLSLDWCAGGLRITQSQLQLLALAEEVDRLSDELSQERLEKKQPQLPPDRTQAVPSANGNLTTQEIDDASAASAADSEHPVADLSPPTVQHCLRPTNDDITSSTSPVAVHGTTRQQAMQVKLERSSEDVIPNCNHTEIPQTLHANVLKPRGLWAYVTGAS